MDVTTKLLDELVGAALLVPSGVEGVYLRGGRFERIVDALDAMVGRFGAVDQPEVLRFPPAMPRDALVRSGYLNSFPQLLGTIHCFCGDEAGHRALLRCVAAGEDWTGQQEPTDLLLTPAACYPLYPAIAARGRLPAEGGIYDMHSWCFRREPSRDPARMQTFRVREFVRMGREHQVMAFRQDWFDRAQEFVRQLSLPFTIDVANDPFFGRAGRLMAESQREQGLKYELLIPVNSEARPTACISFNYHLNHFGEAWQIELADGSQAYSGCVGFGLERLALALFRHHGLDAGAWPPGVRETLRLP
ncbi:MAG TPA: amino acid--[acyl-carrier-protein] ligase [Acetobacteraceae bacterium]